jgi:hypothetical protein
MTTELGALAGALAKAQTEFAPVNRSKTVTVQTKTGGSYKFAYAPLDTILAAVREPLSKNGLVLVQMLDEGALVTTLLHESGASIGGRVDLPATTDIQGFGSAITYLRRYAIQALLGIAAEEDDDGNHAAGNTATFGGGKANSRMGEVIPADPKPIARPTHDGSLIGVAELAKDFPDFMPKQSPEGGVVAFKLVSSSGGIKVIATGDMAYVLPTIRDSIIGQRVSVWGRVRDETFTPKGSKRPVTYQVLDLERIQTADGTLPAPEALPETPDDVPLVGEAPPLFDDVETVPAA